MKKSIKRLTAFLVAFLMTGIIQAAAAFATELVATEIVSSVNNGIIYVEQGQSVNFTINLNKSDDVKLDDKVNVIINTNYKVVGNVGSSDIPSSQVQFNSGKGNPDHPILATAYADKSAVPGTYEIDIKVISIKDESGNDAHKILTDNVTDKLKIVVLKADKTPPEITINSPQDGAFYNADNLPKLDYSVNDDVDGTDVTASTEGFSTTEGKHTVTVTAMDKSGNSVTKSVSYTIDTVAPEVKINYPVEGVYYSNTTRAKNNIYINDLNLDSTSTLVSETGDGDGRHILTVTAFDKAGNSTTKSVSFTMDSTKPVVSINRPLPGRFYKSEVLPDSLELDTDYNIIESSPYKTEITGYNKTDEGAHTVTITATDEASNIGSASSLYTVDNHAPVISMNSFDRMYYKSTELPELGLEVKDNYDLNPSFNTPSLDKTPGLHIYTITAEDKAGNESEREIKYYIDDEKPTLTILSPVNSILYNANNAPSSIEYKTEDNSGIEPEVSFTVDGEPSDGSLPVTNGAHTVVVTSKDRAGNLVTKTITYTNDLCAPKIESTQDPASNIWTRGDITVNVIVQDTGSGVAAVKWAKGNRSEIDFNTIEANLTDNKFMVSENGTYTIYAVDVAGNESFEEVTINNIDKDPPVLSGEATTKPNSNGWYNDNVTIHFTATDMQSGIGSVTEDQTITTEGKDQSVTGTAVDKVGNTSQAVVSGINIDKTAPIINGEISLKANINGWYNTNVIVHFSASDELSGIDNVTEDKTLTEGKDQTVSGTALDKAGNGAKAEINGINIDTTAPVSTIEVGTPNETTGWYNKVAIASISAEDNLSGISMTQYRINNGEWITYEGPVGLSDGISIVDYRSVDKADNVEGYKSVTIKVDTQGPVITYKVVNSEGTEISPNNFGWYKTNVKVDFAAEDSVSGIAVEPSDVDLTEGIYKAGTITASSVDNAGNTSNLTVDRDINIDTTAPEIAGAPASKANEKEWYNSPVTIHFTTSDNLSGIAEPVKDVILSAEGIDQYASATVYDKAGNNASAKVEGIKIDMTKPEISSINDGATYKLNEVVKADWTASDKLSGLESASGAAANGDLLDTSSAGTKTYTVTALDIAGNQMTKTITYKVVYVYAGILQPINNDGSSIFKLGSTVPVKFQLKDINGGYVTNAVANIYYAKVSNNVAGTDLEAVSSGTANTGSLFRYDTSSNQYIFNLSTKGLTTGTYRLTIKLNDGMSYTVNISLR